jgi:hypothetical protein
MNIFSIFTASQIFEAQAYQQERLRKIDAGIIILTQRDKLVNKYLCANGKGYRDLADDIYTEIYLLDETNSVAIRLGLLVLYSLQRILRKPYGNEINIVFDPIEALKNSLENKLKKEMGLLDWLINMERNSSWVQEAEQRIKEIQGAIDLIEPLTQNHAN